MWAYDETDDEYLTPEEQNARYLQQNPALECSLWTEWVGVVCGWDKIPLPTPDEWTALRKGWYHNKAPIDSVADLKRMRENKAQGITK